MDDGFSSDFQHELNLVVRFQVVYKYIVLLVSPFVFDFELDQTRLLLSFSF